MTLFKAQRWFKNRKKIPCLMLSTMTEVDNKDNSDLQEVRRILWYLAFEFRNKWWEELGLTLAREVNSWKSYLG